jgi:hypothetical protein
MINLSSVPEYLFYLVWLIVILAPGYRQLEPVEPPKKGYWTVGSVFWPIRKAYRDLWPVSPALGSGTQLALFLAFCFAAVPRFLKDFVPALSGAIPQIWYLVEVAAVAFIVGRATGFWSADRRVLKDQQADAADAQIEA